MVPVWLHQPTQGFTITSMAPATACVHGAKKGLGLFKAVELGPARYQGWTIRL